MIFFYSSDGFSSSTRSRSRRYPPLPYWRQRFTRLMVAELAPESRPTSLYTSPERRSLAT